MKADEKQPLKNPVATFRKILIRGVIALLAGFIIAYIFSESIFRMMAAPLVESLGQDGHLIYTGLTDMFFIYVKIGFFFGLVIAAPYIFYLIWSHVSPDIPPEEKGYVLLSVAFCCALFMGGVLFGYFFVFPVIFKFLLGYAGEHISALPSVREYITLSLKLLIAFGIVFEVPVLVFFLSRMGLVTVEGFRRNRKFVILLAFIFSAVITPPDVLSQFMMSIPIILLYELGILIAMISGRRK